VDSLSIVGGKHRFQDENFRVRFVSDPVLLVGIPFYRTRTMKDHAMKDLPLEDSASAREVAALIREIQSGLLEYVSGLLGGADGAEDVVQETNIFLWERRHEFTLGSDFRAWALRIAKFKIMAIRRDHARSPRKMMFTDEMFEKLADRAESRPSSAERRMRALGGCLAKMRLQDRRLLELKYVRNASLTEFAETSGQSPNSLHKRVSRLRLALRQCIEKNLTSLP
jgi:RNA polymerase sigma-70 factor, ECF subfamily